MELLPDDANNELYTPTLHIRDYDFCYNRAAVASTCYFCVKIKVDQ